MITKTVRLTGESPLSAQEAVTRVLERATASIRGLERYDVVNVGGRRNDDTWVHEVTVDVTFVVREAMGHE